MLEQEGQALQRLMEIAELRQKGVQDIHLLDWTFQSAEDTREPWPFVLGRCWYREILSRSLHCQLPD